MTRGWAARRRERRHREIPTGELQLAAMVDMMINLLLFLLNLFGKSGGLQHPGEDLAFAKSSATDPVHRAPPVVLDRRAVSIAGDVVGTWTRDGRAPDAAEVEAVVVALGKLDKGDGQEPARLVLQIDRSLAWSTIAPVLGAAGRAGFADVRFVVASVPER